AGPGRAVLSRELRFLHSVHEVQIAQHPRRRRDEGLADVRSGKKLALEYDTANARLGQIACRSRARRPTPDDPHLELRLGRHESSTPPRRLAALLSADRQFPRVPTKALFAFQGEKRTWHTSAKPVSRSQTKPSATLWFRPSLVTARRIKLSSVAQRGDVRPSSRNCPWTMIRPAGRRSSWQRCRSARERASPSMWSTLETSTASNDRPSSHIRASAATNSKRSASPRSAAIARASAMACGTSRRVAETSGCRSTIANE